MSVFVLAGQELKATLEINGPVADVGIQSGMDLMEDIHKFDRGNRPKDSLRISELVDFEYLNLGQFQYEDITFEEREDESAEEKRDRRAQERKKVLENRQRKEQHARNQKRKVRHEGDPFLKTIRAPRAGWYRFCVKTIGNQITAELDVRKESELGGLDRRGHVRTFREKVMAEEEDFIEKDTAEMEGISEEDFQGTREKLKQLRRLLVDIQTKQNQERHRVALHSETNKHSHSRMALNSLMETILFMIVTGYQVYTIRRWFKGAPVLGR